MLLVDNGKSSTYRMVKELCSSAVRCHGQKLNVTTGKQKLSMRILKCISSAAGTLKIGGLAFIECIIFLK